MVPDGPWAPAYAAVNTQTNRKAVRALALKMRFLIPPLERFVTPPSRALFPESRLPGLNARWGLYSTRVRDKWGIRVREWLQPCARATKLEIGFSRCPRRLN